MEIGIKEIQKEDYKKAIQFAIKGMHFDWYLNNQFLLNAYGRYFWYLDINRGTQSFAAYVGGEFAGVILAEIKGEEKKYKSFLQKIYVKFFDVMQRTFLRLAGYRIYCCFAFWEQLYWCQWSWVSFYLQAGGKIECTRLEVHLLDRKNCHCGKY